MILHTLNAAPSSDAFTECLRLVTADDAVLLLGDGEYGALSNTALTALLGATEQLYILTEDAEAAGIVGSLSNTIHSVSIDDFVALTERFSKQLAWY